MRAMVIAGALAAVVGCALLHAAQPDARGQVIVSTTTRTSPTSDGSLRFRCDGGARGEIASDSPAILVTGGSVRSFSIADYFRDRQSTRLRSFDSRGASGHVHVLDLPSGDCEFFSYSAVQYGIGAPFTKTVIVTRQDSNLSIRFHVPPNATAYIGSFTVSAAEGGLGYSYEDQYERDVGMLKARNEPLLGPPGKQLVRRWPW